MYFLKCQNRKITVVFCVNLCFLLLSFWVFLILLFLICFFRHFITPISVDYQYVTSNQQDFKKNDMFICHPHQFIENVMMNYDFKFKALLMSPRYYQSIFFLPDKIWKAGLDVRRTETWRQFCSSCQP